MVHKQITIEYYKELEGTIEYTQSYVKEVIENDEDSLSLLYMSFNKFMNEVDGHQDHPMMFFYNLCVRQLAGIIHFSDEIDSTKMCSFDIHQLVLELFTEWAENNEIEIMDIWAIDTQTD